MYIYIYVDLYIDVMMHVKQDGQISIGGRVFGMNRVNHMISLCITMYHYIISIHFLYQPVIIKIKEQSEGPPHASPPSPATWPVGNGEDHVMWKHKK